MDVRTDELAHELHALPIPALGGVHREQEAALHRGALQELRDVAGAQAGAMHAQWSERCVLSFSFIRIPRQAQIVCPRDGRNGQDASIAAPE